MNIVISLIELIWIVEMSYIKNKSQRNHKRIRNKLKNNRFIKKIRIKPIYSMIRYDGPMLAISMIGLKESIQM